MIRTKILILFLLLFIVGILGVIFYNESILNAGEEIILKTLPRDPRDIIRGDYVVLRYEIGSGQKVQDILRQKFFSKGQKVYTILNKTKDGYGEVKDIVLQKPSDGLFIEAEVAERWGDNLILKYRGIEQYFVPEGKGREIERMSGLEVVVSIKGGKVLIKKLLHNGEEIKFQDIKKRKPNILF